MGFFKKILCMSLLAAFIMTPSTKTFAATIDNTEAVTLGEANETYDASSLSGKEIKNIIMDVVNNSEKSYYLLFFRNVTPQRITDAIRDIRKEFFHQVDFNIRLYTSSDGYYIELHPYTSRALMHKAQTNVAKNSEYAVFRKIDTLRRENKTGISAFYVYNTSISQVREYLNKYNNEYASYSRITFHIRKIGKYACVYFNTKAANKSVRYTTTERLNTVKRRISCTNKTMTTMRKVLEIEKYVCRNLSYDINTPEYEMAIKTGKGNCQAYSRYFYYLCKSADIQCKIVSGSADGANGWSNHAWNRVSIGGEWYHIDACWTDTRGIDSRYAYSKELWDDHRTGKV